MAAKLTNTIIEAAIAGFEAQKKSIDAQIAELRAMLTGTSESPRRGSADKGNKEEVQCRGPEENEGGSEAQVGKDQGRISGSSE
jgi:hypothetical protein